MDNMKKFLTMVLLAALLPLLISCSSGTNPPPSSGQNAAKIPEIGIIQLVEHPALTAAREGFIAALVDNGFKDGENVKLNIQVSSGEQSNLATISDQFVSNKVDLILAIATPAAVSIAGKTTTIPILGTAITDYVVAGLADTNERPGRNISGTSDMNPVREQIDMIFKFAPNAKTVGFVYSSGEDNSRIQIDIAKAHADSIGLAWKEITVVSSADVQQAVESIVRDVDVLYIPGDNVLASTMGLVSNVTMQSKTPVIGAEVGQVESGALATYGINYYNLGYETGEMAVQILREGKNPAEMPIQFSSNLDYSVNGNVADAIGVAIPEEFADSVIR